MIIVDKKLWQKSSIPVSKFCQSNEFLPSTRSFGHNLQDPIKYKGSYIYIMEKKNTGNIILYLENINSLTFIHFRIL